MGEVYRARASRLKREVGLKIPSQEFARDSDRLSRFARESHVFSNWPALLERKPTGKE